MSNKGISLKLYVEMVRPIVFGALLTRATVALVMPGSQAREKSSRGFAGGALQLDRAAGHAAPDADDVLQLA